MDGVKRTLNDRRMDMREASDRARNFNSQLNTSGREPKTCDTPVSHSISIPTEESGSQAHQQSKEHHIHTHEQTH